MAKLKNDLYSTITSVLRALVVELSGKPDFVVGHKVGPVRDPGYPFVGYQAFKKPRAVRYLK